MKNLIFRLFLILPIPHCSAQVLGNSNYTDAQSSRPSKFQTFEGNYYQRPTFALDDKDILVSANAMYNALPDRYVAIFSVTQSALTADLANQTIDNRIHVFLQNLGATGINDEDVYVDMISFVPRYSYATERKILSKTYNEVPSGFELQKNISIQYNDPSLINKLIELATKSEIFDLVKVDCFIRNIKPFRDSLKIACIKEIKKKIKTYEELGIRLDTMSKMVSEAYDVILPQNRYTAYSAFVRSSPPDQKGNAYLVESEKARPIYYDALEYGSFDLIFNPVILTPPIQIVCSVTMRFVLPTKEKFKEAHYMFTPIPSTKK